MEDVTQVIEILIYDSERLSKEELRDIMRKALDSAMEERMVRGATVSGYVGDCSIGRVCKEFPRGVEALECIFDEKEYIPKRCPKCHEGVLIEYSDRYGGVRCDCCTYRNSAINYADLDAEDPDALQLLAEENEKYAALEAQQDIEDEANRREHEGNQPPEGC